MITPSRHVVGHRKAAVVGADRYGNPVIEYGPAVDVAVRAIYGPTIDGQVVDRDQDRDERSILADAGTVFSTPDLVVIDGKDFEVDKVTDWTHGPWVNPVAGVEIQVSRQEG